MGIEWKNNKKRTPYRKRFFMNVILKKVGIKKLERDINTPIIKGDNALLLKSEKNWTAYPV